MEIITFLIPIAIVLGLLFVSGFVWMAMTGQYDDLDTPAHRMLLEDDESIKENVNGANITKIKEKHEL